MEHPRVPDPYKVTAPTSYLDERTTDWYAITLGKEEQLKD